MFRKTDTFSFSLSFEFTLDQFGLDWTYSSLVGPILELIYWVGLSKKRITYYFCFKKNDIFCLIEFRHDLFWNKYSGMSLSMKQITYYLYFRKNDTLTFFLLEFKLDLYGFG